MMTQEQRHHMMMERMGAFQQANDMLTNINMPITTPDKHLEHVLRVADWLLEPTQTQE